MQFQRRKPFTCNNGLTFSLQTGSFMYCSPRDDTGPWHEVEIGYPSKVVPTLLPFAEDRDNPTESIYPFVPTWIVMEMIELNGGLIPADAERFITTLVMKGMQYKQHIVSELSHSA